MEGFGRIAKGHLAFTPEAVDAYKARGTPYIAVLPDNDSPFFKDREKSERISEAMVFGNMHGGKSLIFTSPDHFELSIGAANMAWLHNSGIKAHYASSPQEKHSISIGDVTLHEGEFVTVDGCGGMLYPCDMPIKSPSESIPVLDEAAKKALPNFRVLANAKDFMSTSDAVSSSAEGIGLFRSEDIIRKKFVVMGNNFNDDDSMETARQIQNANLTGKIYSKPQLEAAIECFFGEGEKSNELREYFIKTIPGKIHSELQMPFVIANRKRQAPHETYPITYRLTDLDASQLELEGSKIITPENKKRFFAMQADAMFQCIWSEAGGHFKLFTPLSILIPSVRSAEELSAIKEEIDKAAKKHGFIDETGKRLFRFGAMIETKDAAQPETAAAIARLCDFVSFGTNDLTKDITGIARNDLDPSVKAQCQQWMRDNRCEKFGDSPFDSLVPPVVQAMEKAVRAMRIANPDIEIGCCGRQIASNPQSIEACMKVGLDNISVPPQDIAASRIMVAHFSSKQRLTQRGA